MTIHKNKSRPKPVISFTLECDIAEDLNNFASNQRPQASKSAIVSHALRVYFTDLKHRDPSLFKAGGK